MNNNFLPKNQFYLIVLILINLSMVKDIAADTSIRPFVKGSFQQIQQENKSSPFIITFWSESCVFCMKELKTFGKLLTNYPKIKLISITTDPFLEVETINHILTSKNLAAVEKWVFVDEHVQRLYFDVSRNWRGELPLTFFSDINNNLVKHVGVINEKELIDWLTQQSHSIVE